MQNNHYILESLASDLKRVALGIGRGSFKMSDRFKIEALKRKQELDIKAFPLYIQKLLNTLEKILDDTDQNYRAENALMFSTLFQNYTVSQRSS